jgi:hypothetical protein
MPSTHSSADSDCESDSEPDVAGELYFEESQIPSEDSDGNQEETEQEYFDDVEGHMR